MSRDEDAAPGTVFYFTRSFPYGIGEEWKAVELEHLARQFQVVVVPFTFDGNREARSVPLGVEVREPIFEDDPSWSAWRALRRTTRSRRRMYFAKEFLSSRSYRRRSWLRAWLSASATLDVLEDRARTSGLLEAIGPNDTLVFFWGRGSCDLLPLVRPTGARGVVKMHRYDLFLDANDGYIPYRRSLMDAASWILPTSNAGLAELRSLYPEHKGKIKVAPLGAMDGPISAASDDDVLRLLTCSFVTPVKRLELVAEALLHVRFKVKWTHVGTGPSFDSLRELASRLPANVEVEFLGWVDPRKVRELYGRSPFDVLLNVSSSEGVPISIQEALSAGVPVLATDVGGTSDVVDDGVGSLLARDISATELAEEISRFSALSRDQRNVLRLAARERWETSCDAQAFAASFVRLVREVAVRDSNER